MNEMLKICHNENMQQMLNQGEVCTLIHIHIKNCIELDMYKLPKYLPMNLC